MNLWLSLVIGGIATAISVSIVAYTILEEQRAKNREHYSASREERKMLGAKPRPSVYERKWDADCWANFLLNTVAMHSNPPSMLRLDAHWLLQRDSREQPFAIVAPKNLPHSNRMSSALGKLSWGKPADERLLAALLAQQVAYLK